MLCYAIAVTIHIASKCLDRYVRRRQLILHLQSTHGVNPETQLPSQLGYDNKHLNFSYLNFLPQCANTKRKTSQAKDTTPHIMATLIFNVEGNRFYQKPVNLKNLLLGR